jgi:hypothetical protein
MYTCKVLHDLSMTPSQALEILNILHSVSNNRNFRYVEYRMLNLSHLLEIDFF